MAGPLQGRAAVVGRICDALQKPIHAALNSFDPPIPKQEHQGFEIPHVSFQLVEGVVSKEALQSFRELALEWPPIRIELSGLGFFYRPRQVLYITVVRSPELDALQEEVTRRLILAGYDPHPHYGPETWVPHISLAMDRSIYEWDRLMELEENEVFHRACSIEGLLVLGADSQNPVVFEQDFQGRAGDRQATSPSIKSAGTHR